MEEKKKEVKETKLKKVFICSPFAPRGASPEEMERDLELNIELAQHACRFAVEEGCAPYAPQLFFPQFLSEDDADEREMGILYGLTWLAQCDEVWVIGTRISKGMKKELEKAKEWKIPVRHVRARRITPEDRIMAAIFGDGIPYGQLL